MSDAPRWTWRQRRHLAWLSSPARDPATRPEWAARLGTSEATLAAWEALPGFSAELHRVTLERLRDRLPAILAALADAAEAGDVEAARVVVELARGGDS